jgi:hypothetical protein
VIDTNIYADASEKKEEIYQIASNSFSYDMPAT